MDRPAADASKDELTIKLLRLIISSFDEVDMDNLSDDQLHEWLGQLDIINQGRVKYLESLSDFLYEGLRPHLVRDGFIGIQEKEDSPGLEEAVPSFPQKGKVPQLSVSVNPPDESPFPQKLDLPHAILGKSYSYTFDLEKYYNGHILSPEVEGLEGVRGMEFSVSDLVLKGRPKEPGVYDMILIFLREEQMDRDVIRFQFVVEPDLTALPELISMPVARVDEEYEEMVKIDRSYKFNFKLEGASEAGLEFDPDNMMLTGTPTRGGEFVFKLHFFWEGMRKQVDGSIQIELKVEDAKDSYWQNLLPEDNKPYPKPLEEQKLIDAKEYWLIGASTRGLRHRHLGLHREDDFQLRYSAQLGWSIMAVCDGHPEADFARKGSELAAKVAEQVVFKRLEKYFSEHNVKLEKLLIPKDEAGETELKAFLNFTLTTAIYNAFLYIKRFAQSESLPFDKFATSIKLLISCPLGKKGFFIAGTSIGEGMIGIYHDRTHKLHLIDDLLPLEADKSPHLLTNALITENPTLLNNNLSWFVVEDFSFIALMSGGTEQALFFGDCQKDSAKSWSHYWQEIKRHVMHSTEEEFSQSLLNWLDSINDNPEAFEDRTLILLTPRTLN